LEALTVMPRHIELQLKNLQLLKVITDE